MRGVLTLALAAAVAGVPAASVIRIDGAALPARCTVPVIRLSAQRLEIDIACAPIFGDGFESGALLHWGSTVAPTRRALANAEPR